MLDIECKVQLQIVRRNPENTIAMRGSWTIVKRIMNDCEADHDREL